MNGFEEWRSPPGFDDSAAISRADLERDAMAWPPARWERGPTAWRDDVWVGPEPFTPSANVEAVPAPRLETTASGLGNLFRELAETLVLTALIFLGIRMVVQNFRIEGRSMEPTLFPNEYLLVNKLSYGPLGDPQRGDIIVFQAWNDDKDFIKRVVGIPGDEIQIRDDKVYVNGVPLAEPYLTQPTTDTVGPITLGADEYYVLGDNRGNSSDSRTYGPLPRNRIVGKAWLTYWPPNQVGLIPDSGASFASTPTTNP
jgi:signal peptidase I